MATNKEICDIVLDFQSFDFGDSHFVDGGLRWKAETLYKAAEDLPEFELPIAGIDLSVLPWKIDNIFGIAEHMKRVMSAELKYPVLLDDYGYICDGWHRLVKAMLLKKTHIRAKRLFEMPVADEVLEEQKS